MSTQIEIYEAMTTLSTQMVEAARTHDWEQLIRLEKSVAALRNKLPGEEDNAALTPGEQVHKRELIQGILENDAEVRTRTEPWMEQMRQFLGGSGKRKRVKQAYTAER
jgi:flagellar protein FliT